MQVHLNKCPDAKFQEKATLADWNETNLADAEKFAQNLEQSHLALKRIRNSYGGPRVSKVQARIACRTSKRFHNATTPCPAKGKICYSCKQFDHFASVCGNSKTNFRGHSQRGR